MAALQHTSAPAASGPVTPTSDNTRWQAGVEREQGSADSRDCAAHAAIMEADKAFTTLRAQLAMRGFALHVIDDGAGGAMFLVQRRCQSRTLGSIDDVRAFAVQVGARAAA